MSISIDIETIGVGKYYSSGWFIFVINIFPKGKLSSSCIMDMSYLWWIDVCIRDGMMSGNGKYLLSFVFDLFFILVLYLELFSFFRLSISMILLGLDWVGFCICNPVRSIRVAGTLTSVLLCFVVFCCVMLLFLQLFIEIYESLYSSSMVTDEQGVK